MENENFSYSPDFYEYITPVSRNRKYIFRKAGIIVMFILLAVVSVILVARKPQYSFFVPVILVLFFLGTKFLWRFTYIEFEYAIVQGEMRFDIIYGAKQRKKFFECKISKMDKIGKISDAPKSGFEKTVSAISEKDEDNEYYAVISEESGKKTLLLFEANEKALKIMKSFNPRAFI